MRLVSVRLENVGPFEDTTLRFAPPSADGESGEETSSPRPLTIVFGGDGTGKTSLLSALAVTRPGHTLPPMPAPARGREEPGQVVCEWLLGDDDPERPHPLVVASPAAVLKGETPDAAAARRREQALFDKKAQQEGGFVFVAFSGARWFSRTPNMLTTPEKTVLRHDPRQAASFDDPSRADLTRETKQVLAYSAIARALGADRAEYTHLAAFDSAVRDVTSVMLEPFDLAYEGISPTTFEPLAKRGGSIVTFDAWPRAARHLVAFGVLPLRALFAAYPGSDTPREREGLVAIDDVENQQDPAIARHLGLLLQRALPNVMWILTTSSTHLAMASEPSQVVALRRTGGTRVEIGEGVLH